MMKSVSSSASSSLYDMKLILQSFVDNNENEGEVTSILAPAPAPANAEVAPAPELEANHEDEE